MKTHLTVSILCAGMVLLMLPVKSYSHALHPESIDRHTLITFTPGAVSLVYEIILGINPTERASLELDADQDGVVSDTERDAFVTKRAETYAALQSITLGDTPLTPEFVLGDAYASTGHHGIHVIKIDVGYRCAIPAEVPRDATLSFDYVDHYLTEIPGWKQINVVNHPGTHFAGHVPYREYSPFDYEIINTRGFYPSTNDLDGEVWLSSDSEAPDADAFQLPERRVIEQRRGGYSDKYVLGGVVAFLLLCGVVGVLKSKRVL